MNGKVSILSGEDHPFGTGTLSALHNIGVMSLEINRKIWLKNMNATHYINQIFLKRAS
jgi:hypothetical protein